MANEQESGDSTTDASNASDPAPFSIISLPAGTSGPVYFPHGVAMPLTGEEMEAVDEEQQIEKDLKEFNAAIHPRIFL